MTPAERRLRSLEERRALKVRLGKAEEEGFVEGLRNWQRSHRDYQTGAEFVAWLKGWRLGQIEFRRLDGRD